MTESATPELTSRVQSLRDEAEALRQRLARMGSYSDFSADAFDAADTDTYLRRLVSEADEALTEHRLTVERGEDEDLDARTEALNDSALALSDALADLR
jgi:uncharacterized protein YceH (UPF0502 family)